MFTVVRPKIFLIAFLSIFTFLGAKQGVASHISGINIGYECMGGNTYRITVNVFRDCQDLNLLPPNLNVFISSSCNPIGYVTFPQISLTDVSQLCPAEMPNSKCNGGTLPGIQLGVYQQDVYLEPCSDWIIVVSEQNRDIATVNLVDPSLYSLHVEAFLDNSTVSCNNSPQLTLLNLPYTCVGNPLYYNLGFMDPDGDSLSYAFVPAQASITPNTPFDLNYLPTYSGAEPIPGITIDPVTGQIEVTPMQIGKFNAVVQVSEYRNGVLIGQVSYDFLFVVNACAIPPPTPLVGTLVNVSGGGYALDENTIGICSDDDFCFKIDFASGDPSISVILSSNISQLIPGATETVSGTNPASLTICGTLPSGFQGGAFIVTAIDDACPVYGQAYYAIDFELRQPLQAFNDTVICLGESVQFTAINDTSYSWSSLSGNVLTAGSEISCNPCQNPIVTPDTSTTYVVTGQYANSSCANSDTLTVDIPLRIDVTTTDETCTGNDGVIDINITTGSGDYSIVWNDIGVGSLLRDDLAAGTYSVTLTDNIFGCSRTETYNLIQWNPPTSDAGSDIEVCGLSANLEATPSYGNPLWTGQSGVFFSDNSSATSTVTVPSEGTYPMIWTENAGVGCVDSDTVNVTFYAQPTAQIIAEDSVCGLQVDLTASNTFGNATWQSSSGLTIASPNLANTTAEAQDYGIQSAYLEIQNGLCTNYDTLDILFTEIPVANAGSDVDYCGLNGTVEATDGSGFGFWILPPSLTPQGDLTGESLPVISTSYGVFDVIRELTNAGYCDNTDTASIRFTELPAVNLGPDFGVCDTTAVLNFQLPVGALSWQLSAGLNPISNVESPQQFTGDIGTHQIILNADNGYGCTDSDTLTLVLTVQPILDPVLADTVCGLDYILNGQIIADNQYWLPIPGANITNPNSSSTYVSVDSEGSYYFPWVAENGGACSDTVQVPVFFYNQPLTDAGEDITICGLSVSLSATGSYGSFLWQDLPGITFENAINPASVITADWYDSYSITATETNGICSDSDQVQVLFISTPEIQNPQWECTGADAEFVLTFDVSLGDTANYEVQGVPGTLANFVFTSYPIFSNTPVNAYLQDSGYCGGDTLSGTLYCPIITDAGEMNPDTVRLCGNDSVELNNSANSSLDANDTLLYAFHNGTAVSLGTVFEWSSEPNFEFLPGLTYDETYYISAVAGNATSSGVDLSDPLLSVSPGTPVEFYQPPHSQISGDFMICPYDTILIPVEMAGAMPQELTYTMGGQYFSEWIDSTGFEIAVTDSGVVNLISTQSEFCVGDVSGSVQVDYYALPTAMVAMEPEICDGDTAHISIVFSGDAPYSAVLTQNGNSIATITTSFDSISYPTTTGGDFLIQNITDENCINPDEQSIHLTVKPMPVADAGPDLTICAGDTVQVGNPAIPGQTYSWSNPGGLLSTDAAEVDYAANPNVPFVETTTLILTSGLNGCFAIDTLRITTYPIPVPQIIGASTVCTGDSLSLIGYGGAEYQWQPAENFGHPNAIQSLFSAPGDTEVGLTVTSEGGCTATVAQTVEVLPSPDSLFAVSSAQGCTPFKLLLEAFSTNPGDHYSWHIGNLSNFADTSSIEVSLIKPADYTVSLSVTAANGCTSQMTWPERIEVHSTSAAFSIFPEEPDITNPEVFFRNLSPSGVASEWTFDSLGTSQERDAQFTFPPYVDGRYEICLVVTDSNTCVAQVCKTLKIRGKRFVYVPSAFTPDGDGINDLFYPVLTNVDVAEYHFWITNTRGQIIFETRNPEEKWNGSVNRSDYYQENRVFNWFLVVKPDFNVETEYLQGSVTLIR